MNEEKEKGAKGSTTNKIRKLHRQYNKILVDLFDQFAAESIEEALDKNEGSFGENIQEIIQCALDCLKGKVMNELGVKDNAGGEIDIAVGGIDLADGVGIMGDEEEKHSEDETDEEHEEHEAEETPEEEAEEHAEGESEKDENDEELEEKAPPGAKYERMVKHIKKSEKKEGKGTDEAKKIAFATAWKKHNESDETLMKDKVVSASRRNDQSLLTEAYASIYKK